MRTLFNIIIAIVRKIYIEVKYDNWTIVEYFRRQGAQIGENCQIDIRFLGSEPYLIKIGNHVHIAANVFFHTHDGCVWIFREEIPDINITGPVVIEDNCLIGANSHILANVTIGKNSIVGAGSVVISDVPPDSIVMGVPARIISSTIKYKEKSLAAYNKRKQFSSNVFIGHSKNPEKNAGKKNHDIIMHLNRFFDNNQGK